MTIKHTLAVATLAWGLTLVAQAQDDPFAKAQIKTTDLGNGVYMLEGLGGNIGVSAGEDGLFLIDDQFAQLSDKIRAALAEISDQPVKMILNTHWHGDHTGGNQIFGAEGSLIVAHDNVRKRMTEGLETDVFGRTREASAPEDLPVMTFSHDAHFHLNGLDLHAIHVEASHTDGDSIVMFKGANVIHMGDIFFNGWWPLVDHASGGSLDGMINVQTKVIDKIDDDTKVIPGHGPLATRADLIASRDGLIQIRDALTPLAASDKSLDEIAAMKPLDALELGWGGFMDDDTFVKVVVTGLRAVEDN